MRSPGRNPKRSPASTAGRVRMMRLNCLACRLCTPSATARYDLPVPAGPIPKVITLRAIASTYCFWPLVLGRTVRPRAERSTSAVKTSDGRSSAFTMSMARPTLAESSACPSSSRSTSWLMSAPTRVASGPSTVISLPRTNGVASNDDSMRRNNSSRCPSKPTIRWLSGWILTWVWDTAGGVRLQGLRRRDDDETFPRRSLNPGASPAVPTEDVQVQVGHRVAGVVAHVEHQPVARLGDAFLGRDPLSRRDHLREEVTVLGPKGGGRLDVVARHYEHVDGRGGLDVAERVGARAGSHLVGRDVAGHDPAEQTVAHRRTLFQARIFQKRHS